MNFQRVTLLFFGACTWLLNPILISQVNAQFDLHLPPLLSSANGDLNENWSDWNRQRRPELLAVYQREMYGTLPAAWSGTEFELIESGAAFDGRANRRQYAIRFGSEGPSVDLLLYVPSGVVGRVPAILAMNFWGNHSVTTDPKVRLSNCYLEDQSNAWCDLSAVENHRATEGCRGGNARQWPIELILSRGYAFATVCRNDIDPDTADGLEQGVRSLFPDLQHRRDNFSTIGAWAWGLSRCVDCLLEDERIDSRGIAVFGWSRLGKAALWAAANDRRIALVMSHQGGAGAAKLFSRCQGETLQQLNNNAHWFCSNFKKYNGLDDRLPFDQHMLIGCIAPRPVCIGGAVEDLHADPEGEFWALKHTEPLYCDILGLDGVPANAMLSPGQAAFGHLGFHFRTGGHDVTIEDWSNYLSFADLHLQPVADRNESSQMPTLFLVGDSTVRCGSANGENGMWGWGQLLPEYFDLTKIRVVNRAIGGRSSRTFITEGRWEQVRYGLRPGDYVIMQFGHNDGGEMFTGSRPRASIKGIGEETAEGVVESTGSVERVHTYGWYLRKMVRETQAAGATAIVASPVPRNRWNDGKILRTPDSYADWARQVAEETDAPFIDLHERVALAYEELEAAQVKEQLFTPADDTHTSRAGATINAEQVVRGLRDLECPVASAVKDSTVAEPQTFEK